MPVCTCKMASAVLFNLTAVWNADIMDRKMPYLSKEGHHRWHVKKALNTVCHFVSNFVSYTSSTQPVQQRIVAPSKYCFVPVDQVWIKGGDWRVNRACYCMTSFDQLVGSRGLERRAEKRVSGFQRVFSKILTDGRVNKASCIATPLSLA